MRRRIWRWVLLVMVLGLLLVQFIPVVAENPAVTREVAWDSPRTLDLARRACFDCHSHETVWPFYARIAPLSWYLNHHVVEGREHLNFSTPGEVDVEECRREIERGGMPLWDYVLLHPSADLSETDKADLIAGLSATFGSESSHPAADPAEDREDESE